MSVAEFMAVALFDPQDGYYARHVRLGADGDFLTAPEISQMFGECVGLWCAQAWFDLGSPAPLQLVELGPGSGALAADLWRAAAVAPGFRDALALTLVEPSAPLRAVQGARLRGARVAWADTLEAAPAGPTIVLANEVLDCLPIRQIVQTGAGWRERVLGLDAEGALAFGLGPPVDTMSVPEKLRDAPPGAVFEVCPALEAVIAGVAERLCAHGGHALFIDYGAAEPSLGDSLQAVRARTKESPLAAPGLADLTAHVDFAAVASAARSAGLHVHGPVAQGAWLRALGIEARTAALARAQPHKADVIARQRSRLVDDDAMGALFKVICLSAPGQPPPPGFDS